MNISVLAQKDIVGLAGNPREAVLAFYSPYRASKPLSLFTEPPLSRVTLSGLGFPLDAGF